MENTSNYNAPNLGTNYSSKLKQTIMKDEKKHRCYIENEDFIPIQTYATYPEETHTLITWYEYTFCICQLNNINSFDKF